MHKGGVGKTTIAVNLAAGLADAGKRVLLVDLDPQAGASRYLAAEASGSTPRLADVLGGRAGLLEAAVPVRGISRLRMVPGDLTLAGRARELRDTNSLQGAAQDLGRKVDVLMIDSPPGWNMLSINGLVAATELLAPVELKTMSMAAVVDLVRMLEDVKENLNRDLELAGVVPSRVLRTRLSAEGLEDLRRHFGRKVLPAIRESARVAEAPGHHLPLSRYAPASAGDADFAALTRAVLRLRS